MAAYTYDPYAVKKKPTTFGTAKPSDPYGAANAGAAAASAAYDAAHPTPLGAANAGAAAASAAYDAAHGNGSPPPSSYADANAGAAAAGAAYDAANSGPAGSTAGPSTTTGGPPQPGLFSEPGAYEKWVKDHLGEFDTPWATESLGGSAYDDWYAQNKDAFAAPGQRERNAQRSIDAAYGVQGPSFNFSGPTIGSGREAYAMGKEALSDPGAMEAKYAQMGDALDGPGNMEAIYAAHGMDPFNKGYTENLYESGMDRLNPYYDYAEDRAFTKARNSSAARGGFNTGLAAQQESDITSNLRGQQAKEQSDLAPLADAERRARYDQGFKFAGDTDAEQRARVEAAFGIAKDAQGAEENRYKTIGDLASTADAGTAAEGNIALGAAKAAADTEYNRGRLQLEGIRTADDVAAGADESLRNRTLDSAGLAANKDQTDLGRAQAIDAAHGGRLVTGSQLARGQQDAGQERIQGMINSIAGQDQREANLLTTIYNDYSSVDKVDETWFQAEAEKLGIPIEELKTRLGILKGGIDTGVNAVETIVKAV